MYMNQNVFVYLFEHLPADVQPTNMALHQIASITALVFMAQHVGASIFERTTCPTGQTVTNGACCGQYI